MKVIILVPLILLISLGSASGQKTDTIQFRGFKGIICDSLTTPYGSKKIFPKKRFNPSSAEVRKVENELIQQYGKAIIKHHNLMYKEGIEDYIETDTIPFNIEDLDKEDQQDVKWYIEYKKNGKEYAQRGIQRLKKEYQEYDRNYYGMKQK